MVKKAAVPFSRNDCKSYMSRLMAQTGIEVSEQQMEDLVTLIEMLNLWNGALNLTAIREVAQMVQLHVVDSAVLVPVLDQVFAALDNKAGSGTGTDGFTHHLADVGTGAGFPGLVLAILRPEWHFTLIDSVGKKLSFVRQVATRLKLKNVELINKRCEEIEHEPFEVIVSRAFAPLERMVSWCLPLLYEKGRFVAMKANLEDSEIKDIPETVTIDSIIELNVPELEAKRQAVVLQPVAAATAAAGQSSN